MTKKGWIVKPNLIFFKHQSQPKKAVIISFPCTLVISFIIYTYKLQIFMWVTNLIFLYLSNLLPIGINGPNPSTDWCKRKKNTISPWKIPKSVPRNRRKLEISVLKHLRKCLNLGKSVIRHSIFMKLFQYP